MVGLKAVTNVFASCGIVLVNEVISLLHEAVIAQEGVQEGDSAEGDEPDCLYVCLYINLSLHVCVCLSVHVYLSVYTCDSTERGGPPRM